MTHWSDDLAIALADGDPAYMNASLAQVPKDVLARAAPYLREMARKSVRENELDESLAYYDQLISIEPDDEQWYAERARVLLRLDRLEQALSDAERVIELAPGESIGHQLRAEAHDGRKERSQALAAYREAQRLGSSNAAAEQRIAQLETELRNAGILQAALGGTVEQAPPELDRHQQPKVTFDPALLIEPSIPATADARAVDALKSHLSRYGALQSVKNTLARLDDPHWLSSWDDALSSLRAASVLFHGSELGLLALRAVKAHGAKHASIAEISAYDARIATGIVQKSLLSDWHAANGAEIARMTEDERRQSFEAFAEVFAIVSPDDEALPTVQPDFFVFPNIDHTLLGTGIVNAVRRYRSEAQTRVLPARARVFARGIQWVYPSTAFDLTPVNRLRWSCYPQSLDVPDNGWAALTEPLLVCEIDFENFNERTLEVNFPVTRTGTLDAVVYWFELDLGNARITSAPDSPLRCIRPAVQYTDPTALSIGDTLPLQLRIETTRLQFSTRPAPTLQRSDALPSWYVPMLLDENRNAAFAQALARAIAVRPPENVLDIGAGCGLLSMLAAEAGAARTVACEVQPAIAAVCREVIALNRLEERISVVSKDCRSLQAGDIVTRADLAVFELFDCSLIGEGVLHFLAYAREHLLAQDARYLPMAAKLRGLAIEYRLDRLLGCDVNLLNPYRFSPSFINVDGAELDYRPLSEPFDVFAFDFATATAQAEQKELQLTATSTGTVGAVLFWFDLQLDEHTWLSNSPDRGTRSHWKQGLQFLPEVEVASDTALRIIASHDGSSLEFGWKPGSLPQDRLSKLPRFDPRLALQAQQLEQQTAEILRHCHQHPDERIKVADLALRFAVDPAAHGLDPRIAQRFAATFLGS